MLQLMEAWQQIQAFLERGGPVLVWILWVIFAIWVLVIERVIYLRVGHKHMADEVRASWEARAERSSWHAHQIRQAMLAEARMNLERWMGVIKTLVGLCPLLGLLGSVTGMIQVFDVMAVAGTGNARAMAAGVSQATVPTMAGMVAALSGVWFATHLEVTAANETERLEDLLHHH